MKKEEKERENEMNSTQKYVYLDILANQENPSRMDTDVIDELSNEERKQVRDSLWNKNPNLKLPRNLSYNYTTQEYID